MSISAHVVLVFPVPGGPWMSESETLRYFSTQARCDAFKYAGIGSRFACCCAV